MNIRQLDLRKLQIGDEIGGEIGFVDIIIVKFQNNQFLN
jgi:hypothetical protein